MYVCMYVCMSACLYVCIYVLCMIFPFVQVWEQEVAWTEADKPIKVAARALTIPKDHKLSTVPIFCFETMMHMLYWSCLVYDYKRVCSLNPSAHPTSLHCATCHHTCTAVRPLITVALGSYYVFHVLTVCQCML